MRLLSKQPVWISNEPYEEAFMIEAIVSPKTGNVEHDFFGVMLDYNVQIAVELENVKGLGIAEDSWFWLNRGDNPPNIPAVSADDGATHSVRGIQVTADNKMAFIALKSNGNYNPLA